MADLTGMRHGAVEELMPPRAADPRHTLRVLVPLAHLLGYASSVRAIDTWVEVGGWMDRGGRMGWVEVGGWMGRGGYRSTGR